MEVVEVSFFVQNGSWVHGLLCSLMLKQHAQPKLRYIKLFYGATLNLHMQIVKCARDLRNSVVNAS